MTVELPENTVRMKCYLIFQLAHSHGFSLCVAALSMTKETHRLPCIKLSVSFECDEAMSACELLVQLEECPSYVFLLFD